MAKVSHTDIGMAVISQRNCLKPAEQNWPLKKLRVQKFNWREKCIWLYFRLSSIKYQVIYKATNKKWITYDNNVWTRKKR